MGYVSLLTLTFISIKEMTYQFNSTMVNKKKVSTHLLISFEMNIFYQLYVPPPPPERSLGGYLGITLSLRLSEKIRVRPITFFWFDIGLPYLAHGSITIRRCVAYVRPCP